jgi:predicted amidohydrolase
MKDTVLSTGARKVTVACVQARAHDRDAFASRLPGLLALIEQGAKGAQLVVVPEGTVPGYVIGTAPLEAKQIDLAREAIAAIAVRYRSTIVYGTARLEGGRAFNSALVIGPEGSLLGYADKQFLWHFDRRWFAPGRRLEPIDTPAGRLGVLVCADGRIPTIAATLADRGAEVLVMPTAWVTSGRDPAALENVQADLMAAVRAQENGVPFVAANKCGVEANSVLYCGKSTIIEGSGAIIARASERDECVIFGEVEMGTPRSARGRVFAATPAPAGAAHARIAITPSNDPPELVLLAAHAALADATLLLAGAEPDEPTAIPVLDVTRGSEGPGLREISGVELGVVDAPTARNPHGLVEARLGGTVLFAYTDADEAGTTAFARTRALELRAYVVVLTPRRAFACDPDGAIVCGTLDDFRVAAFVYDRARTQQTMVAPGTDVLEGLREARAIAARSPLPAH